VLGIGAAGEEEQQCHGGSRHLRAFTHPPVGVSGTQGQPRQSSASVEGPSHPPDSSGSGSAVSPRQRSELIEISRPAVREIEADWAAHLEPVLTRQLKEALLALREITDSPAGGG
jgi:hypothetical protein